MPKLPLNCAMLPSRVRVSRALTTPIMTFVGGTVVGKTFGRDSQSDQRGRRSQTRCLLPLMLSRAPVQLMPAPERRRVSLLTVMPPWSCSWAPSLTSVPLVVPPSAQTVPQPPTPLLHGGDAHVGVGSVENEGTRWIP